MPKEHSKHLRSKTISVGKGTNDSFDSDSDINNNDDKSEVDITEVTKHVLTKWGIVRKPM